MEDKTDSLIDRIDTAALLARCKKEYSGVAQLGIEALELKIKGCSGADIARLYHTEPNHVGAWISRAKAKLLFRRDRSNQREAQILALSKQALLSTAELVKCAEADVSGLSTDQKVMAALYNDDFTTCDNIRWEMMQAESREDVTLAVANLYLRKQIIFGRLG